ncbi:MAG: hypothetical protein FJ134_04260 [Deltaproteobacteria bacterium]|nr:hypothetical protein [Deltaproteobacteria bacterium]
MKNLYVKKMPESIRFRVVLCILLLGLIYGCQAQEPPLSPAAAAFKQEIKECIDRLVKPLMEPVLKRDTAGINETLKKVEPEAIKLCRMCPFRIGVVDQNGDTLAVYPPQKNAHLDFHNYEVVQQALKSRKISHQRLFLQDGSSLYVICVPLIREEPMGILAIALSAADAQNRWGLTEKEFVALDFNR